MIAVVVARSSNLFRNRHRLLHPAPDYTPTMDERDFVADSEEEDNLMDTGMQKDLMNWQEEISTCESWLVHICSPFLKSCSRE
jgi:hypothetical protein